MSVNEEMKKFVIEVMFKTLNPDMYRDSFGEPEQVQAELDYLVQKLESFCFHLQNRDR